MINILLNQNLDKNDFYYNKINMAHSSTVDWTREPVNSMAGIINTLAEDMQW